MTVEPLPTKREESWCLAKIAGPLVISYLADSLGFIFTKAAVGKLGFLPLAAVGVSTDLSFQVAFIALGFFSVTGVVVAEALGANRREDILVALGQGLWMSIVAGLMIMAYVANLGHPLHVARQAPEVMAAAAPYYQALAPAMLAFTIYSVLRAFLAAMGRSGFIMIVTLISVGVQFVAMNGLVHGSYGLPALGVAGAGAGWSAVMWLRCVLLGAFVLWLVRREKLALPQHNLLARVFAVKHFALLAFPVAGVVGLESCMFTATSIMSGWIGPVELASFQVLIGWVAIPFMISLASADAAMVRVSYWMGAERRAAARQAGLLGLVLGTGIPLMLVAVPLLAPHWLISFFLSPASDGFDKVSGVVVSLLAIAALFQLFDGLQAIASHVLRGLRDARMPLLISGFGYLVIGIGASYGLAFHLGWQVRGLWWGVALGLGFVGSLLAWRFERLSR